MKGGFRRATTEISYTLARKGVEKVITGDSQMLSGLKPRRNPYTVTAANMHRYPHEGPNRIRVRKQKYFRGNVSYLFSTRDGFLMQGQPH